MLISSKTIQPLVGFNILSLNLKLKEEVKLFHSYAKGRFISETALRYLYFSARTKAESSICVTVFYDNSPLSHFDWAALCYTAVYSALLNKFTFLRGDYTSLSVLPLQYTLSLSVTLKNRKEGE